MKLPVEFLEKMKILMGEKEYEEFVLSFNMPRYYGLRVNTLKISVDQFLRISPFRLERVPWSRDGFYYDENDDPGKHPYYHAGLYYMQEPSAMFPAEVLDARPGEYVLDLCAAPGGKTVQIAAGMRGEGLLVANDLNPARVKALVKNIELCGVRNAIVTNETPGKLTAKFTGYFDKILVDAPCSGEGMFRKDKSAIRSWERYKSKDFSVIQEDILESAEKMLKPGGRIVYSTCTFSPGENEEVISSFLERNENYELLEIPLPEGTERGRPEWADGDERMKKCVRFWPHKARGEGHFIALLGKKGHGRDPGRISPGLNASLTENQNKYCLSSVEIRDFPGKIRGNTKKLMDNYREIFAEFVNKNLNAEIGELGLCLEGNRRSLHKNLSIEIRDQLLLIGDNLYWLPVHLPDLDGIKVVRFGWHLGRFKKSSSMRTSNTDNMLEHMFEYMFEPSQAMIMPLEKGDLKRVVDFPPDSMEIIRYLKGETLLIEGEKGIIGVCMDGYTVGWAKQTGKEMKNLYPPGWRWIPSEN